MIPPESEEGMLAWQKNVNQNRLQRPFGGDASGDFEDWLYHVNEDVDEDDGHVAPYNANGSIDYFPASDTSDRMGYGGNASGSRASRLLQCLSPQHSVNSDVSIEEEVVREPKGLRGVTGAEGGSHFDEEMEDESENGRLNDHSEDEAMAEDAENGDPNIQPDDTPQDVATNLTEVSYDIGIQDREKSFEILAEAPSSKKAPNGMPPVALQSLYAGKLKMNQKGLCTYLLIGISPSGAEKYTKSAAAKKFKAENLALKFDKKSIPIVIPYSENHSKQTGKLSKPDSAKKEEPHVAQLKVYGLFNDGGKYRPYIIKLDQVFFFPEYSTDRPTKGGDTQPLTSMLKRQEWWTNYLKDLTIIEEDHIKKEDGPKRVATEEKDYPRSQVLASEAIVHYIVHAVGSSTFKLFEDADPSNLDALLEMMEKLLPGIGKQHNSQAMAQFFDVSWKSAEMVSSPQQETAANILLTERLTEFQKLGLTVDIQNDAVELNLCAWVSERVNVSRMDSMTG